MDRPSPLAVLEQRGQHDGRSVNYIRIFEPAWAQARSLDVRAFGDLDAHPSLILKSGHIETDGTVVITARAPDSEAGLPMLAMTGQADPIDETHVEHHPDGR